MCMGVLLHARIRLFCTHVHFSRHVQVLSQICSVRSHRSNSLLHTNVICTYIYVFQNICKSFYTYVVFVRTEVILFYTQMCTYIYVFQHICRSLFTYEVFFRTEVFLVYTRTFLLHTYLSFNTCIGPFAHMQPFFAQKQFSFNKHSRNHDVFIC